ncbi:hypothetical protein M885DRAFT_620961 [Pelagophyceae sp. CCMP2097]|nr:hypothetical protein M885DRAFT_620961 [Pelagophyceae sp. CCMP2097]
MHMILHWIIVAAVARAALVPHDDATTAQCLFEGACDAEAACPTAPAFTRACLDARVPFRTPYTAVRCCLRCCLRHWLRAYGLDANWAHFFSERGSKRSSKRMPVPNMDEVLLGFGPLGTLGFAARRLTIVQMQWLKHQSMNLSKEMRGGKDGTYSAEDRSESLAAIWAAKRTSPQAAAGLGAWRDTDAWIDLSFGDTCGAHGGGNAFALYRELTLATLAGGFLPQVVAANARNPKAVLVSSTDCDLPHSTGPTRPEERFSDARRLLDSPHLEAWYHTNPSDHVAAGHPKLRAVPIGILHRGDWVAALDGREAADDRPNLVACCCMASEPPIDRVAEGLAGPRFYAKMKGPDRDALLEARLIEPATLDVISSRRGSFYGEGLSRARRFAVIEALARNGLPCSHGRVTAEAARARMLESTFVVSPQGKGRACYREWESLAAGAIPLVDWDASPAMTRLYEGLPVVRVRDWRNVTGPFLRAKLEEIRAANERGEIDLGKVYLPYWIARFTEHLAPHSR